MKIYPYLVSIILTASLGLTACQKAGKDDNHQGEKTAPHALDKDT